MKLKVKFLKLTAGRPVAILHKKFAMDSGIHVDDRILIRKNSHKTIAVVDIAIGMLEKNDIAVSTEISKELGLKEGDIVQIEIAPKPESIFPIIKKLQCQRLNRIEIQKIIQDIVKNALTESEIAYFVSAVYRCGMSMQETLELINALVDTGRKLNLKQKIIVDKHSCGGIPGRTTPIVVSICAAAGLTMPKTSSRAITTPSGTADALETICKVDFTIPEVKKIIQKTGACMVWNGSLRFAPADDKIIQVERLLNLDPEAQLIASIMAKKIAVGSKYVLIEVPYGKYAKFDKKTALRIKHKFEEIGKFFRIKLKAYIVKTTQPLGNGIGPALEIKDVISVLKRESSCFQLEARALNLASQLLELSGKAKKNNGMEMAREILESGKAFEKFKQIISAQHGKINHIKDANFNHDIKSTRNCKISEINIKQINLLARVLGCPADKSAGIYLHKHINDKIKKGETILTLYSESKSELKEGISYYNKYKPIIFK